MIHFEWFGFGRDEYGFYVNYFKEKLEYISPLHKLLFHLKTMDVSFVCKLFGHTPRGRFGGQNHICKRGHYMPDYQEALDWLKARYG